MRDNREEDEVISREHAVVRIFENDLTPESMNSRLEWLRRHMDAEHNSELTYIWQIDTPKMSTSSEGGLQYIKINLDYGDNVEDEWYLTWLITEYTRTYKMSIADLEDLDDGQFLLIEAAYHLPKWLEGEISINRVWLRDGLVHIIAPPQTPAEITSIPNKMTPKIALNVILDDSVNTLASKGVQKVIRERVGVYPAKVTIY